MSFTEFNSEPLKNALNRASTELLSEALASGYWEGELSGSALSTATALTAGSLWIQARPEEKDGSWSEQVFFQGFKWLLQDQNPDGGWGDTDLSLSNISTTALVWGALTWAPKSLNEEVVLAEKRAEAWLTRQAGSLDPKELSRAITRRYGKDRTFSVPILTLLSLCGRLGPAPKCWRLFPSLPFELSIFPKSFFAALKLPVVSYALPALIAMGIVRAHRAPSINPMTRWIRKWSQARALRVLDSIQPENGGFLEATPLTSFVSMSLIGAGLADLGVTQKCLSFLSGSQREDGCWPIDTHLATWGTTLSIGALSEEKLEHAGVKFAGKNLRWLLDQQYQEIHPYTNAAPGGWAWTPLPGGVPDADDTPGAILALMKWKRVIGSNHLDQSGLLESESARLVSSMEAGAMWLMGLQNRDGGIPTFCRGWGSLPFDRSSADLTAHSLRAWTGLAGISSLWENGLEAASEKALRFLEKQQAPNGQWTPLWFGNQYLQEEENPVYGTSRALLAFAEILPGAFGVSHDARIRKMAEGAVLALKSMRHPNGAWGGVQPDQASIEETALAVEGLAAWAKALKKAPDTQLIESANWLAAQVKNGSWTQVAPIGFYFAKLWYYEALYPKVWTVAALRRTVEALQAD